MNGSRGRNFRRRGDDDAEGGDGDASAAGKPPSTAASSSSAKHRKPQNSAPKKLLSFADDEEEEDGPLFFSSKPKSRKDREKSASRIGKPSSSHKITPAKDRVPTPSSMPSNVQPQAGMYTKEALLELQKNTRTLAAPSSRAQSVSSASEPKVILKGLLKPQSPQDESAQTKSRDSVSDEEQSFQSRQDGARGTSEIGNESEFFPDEATIKAIRAKRERMRQARVAAAPDYIPIDGSANHAAPEGLSDEDADFQGSFVGERLQGSKKGVFEDVDERAIARDTQAENYDNDEDEEDKLWEQEQVKKALGKIMDDRATGLGRSNNGAAPALHTVQPLQQKHIYGTMPGVTVAPTSIGGAVEVASGLETMSISQQAELAKKALQENVHRLKESHSKTISSLSKADENLSASLLNITALEKSLSVASEKYVFMQKLRDFVSVTCDLLQEKHSLIEELEAQMKELNEKRALAIAERRAADNDDQMKEVEVAVKAAMTVVSERGSSNTMVASATNAALTAIAAVKEKNLPVQLDEFGRDMNLQKRKDKERRAAVRNRRKAQFNAKRLSAMEVDESYVKIEGESSTDESDSEAAAYSESRNTLLECAEKVFSDASEEYSQLSAVKETLERWKRDYSSSYRDAYMALSAPAIFSPFVRLELLKWDPLHEDAGFFDMKWYLLLFDYGRPDDGSDFPPDDADANLVPDLVEKFAVPILHHEVAHCWDMFSTRETRNAVSATSLVIDYVPASSKALAELLVSIRTRLAEAVASIMVPTWNPLLLKAVPNAAQVAAYRFGMSVRLMRNMCLWKDILAQPVLEKLVLDELLFGKVLPHIRSIASDMHDAVTRTERIIASLSGVWAGRSVTLDHSRKLQPLVDYVMSLGRGLHKKRASGVSETEIGGLARRLKKMLVELNEYDSAREIARTFHLKEAV